MDPRSAWKSTTERPSSPSGARAPLGLRCGALLLLLVLVTGLNIISLTSEWLSAVPYHDHAFFRGYGSVPHAHPGDQLTRSAAALKVVASPLTARAEADTPPGFGVVSLRANSAAEVVSGMVSLATASAGFAFPLPGEHSRGYPAPPTTGHDGEQPTPIPPPPRKG